MCFWAARSSLKRPLARVASSTSTRDAGLDLATAGSVVVLFFSFPLVTACCLLCSRSSSDFIWSQLASLSCSPCSCTYSVISRSQSRIALSRSSIACPLKSHLIPIQNGFVPFLLGPSRLSLHTAEIRIRLLCLLRAEFRRWLTRGLSRCSCWRPGWKWKFSRTIFRVATQARVFRKVIPFPSSVHIPGWPSGIPPSTRLPSLTLCIPVAGWRSTSPPVFRPLAYNQDPSSACLAHQGWVF